MSYTVLHDPNRLRVLKRTGLLDSLPDPAFDRLTGLAQRLLGVPVALVSLVDDHRQFFASAQGLPDPWATCRETPLSHSFCQHVVGRNKELIVGDARQHALVKDNLAIPDLGVMAYAGYPLRAPDGQVLGSFCAIDTASREWLDSELLLLEELAAVAAGQIHLCLEIEERKQAEGLLVEARRQAEAANEAKSIFLASMSHELRTPLNAILGFSQMLSHETYGELNPKQARYVSNIHCNGDHMLGLINDLLDLSRIESGRTELELAEVRLDLLIQQVVMETEALLSQKPVELEVDLPQQLPTLQADPVRLRQVLLNLLGNAVKFTSRGWIRVTLRPEQEGLRIEVSDSGIGLADEDRERIFDHFEQVRGSLPAGARSTGLGLAVTRALVQLHGGEVWAESDGPGKGSTFIVRLPG